VIESSDGSLSIRFIEVASLELSSGSTYPLWKLPSILTASLVARIIRLRFIVTDYAQSFPSAGEHRFGNPLNFNFLLWVFFRRLFWFGIHLKFLRFMFARGIDLDWKVQASSIAKKHRLE
jgi:hypothetical protein